jgi:adenylate kinase
VVLLGAPGAGKGTQAEALSKHLDVPHIATGDLFRAARQSETDIGNIAAGYMDRGELVPDEVVVRMLLERISLPDAQKGYLLDGFPRTLDQAKSLSDALEQNNSTLDAVLYLNVSNGELIERLSGRWICRKCQTPYHAISAPPKNAGTCDRCEGELYQREDDQEETVRTRLNIFEKDTAPLIHYYKSQGILSEILGEGDVKDIENKMISSLS